MKQRNLVPLIMIFGGALFIIGAVASIIWFSNSSDQEVSGSELIYVGGPQSDIPRINLTNAKKAYDDGTAIFLDVRGHDAYAINRTPGAVDMPESEIMNRLGELATSDWIITYCS